MRQDAASPRRSGGNDRRTEATSARVLHAVSAYAVHPNQMVTFRHPNGRYVTVPIRMPAGTPRLEHRPDRIIYNFGDYTVEARFLPDGSVDVIYNSGLLRPLQLRLTIGQLDTSTGAPARFRHLFAPFRYNVGNQNPLPTLHELR